MLSVEAAYAEVLTRARRLPAVEVDLSRALGLVLAEDVTADLDAPPFDKALVDGFAVRSADLSAVEDVALVVVEEVVAGAVPSRPIGPGEAVSIMTGAPLPEGADAVVMVEQALAIGGPTVRLRGPVRPGQYRMTRGREMRRGDVVLTRGMALQAPSIGVLAAVGKARVRAIPRPVVAVVATGDELVPVDRTPGPGQIRNANAAMLAALAESLGGEPRPSLPIAADRPADLAEVLGRALHGDDAFPLAADVLLVSGGVSAGARDLVPAALLALGVTPVFHKLRLKPGKPLWFGTGPPAAGHPGALVFGLPGNPVSGVVGGLLFAGPAIARLRGLDVPDEGPRIRPATLDAPFVHRGDRPTFHPAKVTSDVGKPLRVRPLDWAGSPDLRAVASADGFLHVPAGDRAYEPGEAVGFLPLPGA